MAHTFRGYQNYLHRPNKYRANYTHHTTTRLHQPQWEIVSGKVFSSRNPSDTFHGNEILEVSVVNASLMDAPSVLLGRQKIALQHRQQFPMRFEFYYDKSRAGAGHGGLTMQARIVNTKGQLLYINDTHTPLTKRARIDVKRV